MVTESFQKAPGDSSAKSRAPGLRWAADAATRDNARMDTAHLDIRLNGDALALPAPCTLTELLAAQGLAERRVAVEVNGEIVPRGRHADHLLADGDVVEIVHALGGG